MAIHLHNIGGEVCRHCESISFNDLLSAIIIFLSLIILRQMIHRKKN